MQRTQRMTVTGSGVQRPSWITTGVKQLAILVRDRSGSMSGQKACDASAASGDLVNELAQPVNRDGFEVAIIDFDDTADVIHDVSPATALKGRVKSINPDGGTNITDGLAIALDIINRGGMAEATYLRPIVLLFSDGGHNEGTGPEGMSDSIKLLGDLVTVAFGSDADEALLQRLASSPQHFYRCRNGAELRTFFAAVGATMTASLQSRRNATQALSQIRFA